MEPPQRPEGQIRVEDEVLSARAEPRDDIRCVHHVQADVDLKGDPERALEAADHPRSKLLTWNARG